MSMIFSLLALVAAGVLITVIFSYAFVWYEAANRDPELMEQRFSPRSLWWAVQMIGVETLCLLATVLLHPLGWLRPKEPPLSSAQTPIILLHGLFHNRACWLWIAYRLRQMGLTSIYTLNLPPWKDLETLTERVAQKVDALRHAGGSDQVHLVGHSMGGIIARNYLQLRGGAGKVGRCIFLGTPNQGSKLAPFAVSGLGKLLLPGSDFLQHLESAPLPFGTEFISLSSRHDNLVIPCEAARWAPAQNIELQGIGHTTLLYHPEVLRHLSTALQGDAS